MQAYLKKVRAKKEEMKRQLGLAPNQKEWDHAATIAWMERNKGSYIGIELEYKRCFSAAKSKN